MRRVDIADTDGRRAPRCDGADLLWLESPTNPLLEVADLPALVAAGPRRGALVVVDNTFATPLRAAAARARAPTSSCTR